MSQCGAVNRVLGKDIHCVRLDGHDEHTHWDGEFYWAEDLHVTVGKLMRWVRELRAEVAQLRKGEAPRGGDLSHHPG